MSGAGLLSAPSGDHFGRVPSGWGSDLRVSGSGRSRPAATPTWASSSSCRIRSALIRAVSTSGARRRRTGRGPGGMGPGRGSAGRLARARQRRGSLARPRRAARPARRGPAPARPPSPRPPPPARMYTQPVVHRRSLLRLPASCFTTRRSRPLRLTATPAVVRRSAADYPRGLRFPPNTSPPDWSGLSESRRSIPGGGNPIVGE